MREKNCHRNCSRNISFEKNYFKGVYFGRYAFCGAVYTFLKTSKSLE